MIELQGVALIGPVSDGLAVRANRLNVSGIHRGLFAHAGDHLGIDRNQGLGTALMGALLGHADDQQITASLHVEPFNPALRMYQRLGFVHAETRGVYWFMQRPPQSPGQLKIIS